MKIAIITCICASLAGCVGTVADGGDEAPESQDGSEPVSATIGGTVNKFSTPERATDALRGLADDHEVPFSSKVTEVSETVSLRAKFDSARAHDLEAFRARLGVAR
jgi:hypothetical protein